MQLIYDISLVWQSHLFICIIFFRKRYFHSESEHNNWIRVNICLFQNQKFGWMHQVPFVLAPHHPGVCLRRDPFLWLRLRPQQFQHQRSSIIFTQTPWTVMPATTTDWNLMRRANSGFKMHEDFYQILNVLQLFLDGYLQVHQSYRKQVSILLDQEIKFNVFHVILVTTIGFLPRSVK